MVFEAPPLLLPLPDPFIIKDVNSMIKHNKSLGYDLITERLVDELSRNRIVITIFYTVLCLGYYSPHCKVVLVILIPKPGMPPTEVTSYTPISLLSILSKLLEKLLLTQLSPIVKSNNFLSEH